MIRKICMCHGGFRKFQRVSQTHWFEYLNGLIYELLGVRLFKDTK